MALIITPTGRRIFKVWWSIEWRKVLFAAIVGTILGFPLALLNVVLAWILASLIGVYISFAVTKWALTRKLYSDFTIALIEKEKIVEE